MRSRVRGFFAPLRMTILKVSQSFLALCSGDDSVCEAGMLKVGEDAPDFDLEAVTGDRTHRVRLSEFRGKNVAILFHPLDWTPT